MIRQLIAKPIPTPEAIRARHVLTGSVRLTAARCGVPIDVVRDALIQRPA